jgi:hypothetical protein
MLKHGPLKEKQKQIPNNGYESSEKKTEIEMKSLVTGSTNIMAQSNNI